MKKNLKIKFTDTLLLFFIAKRYLFAKKMQTGITVLSVTFGISMFILMINFMTGVNDFLDGAAFEGTPDIRLFIDKDNELPPSTKKEWRVRYGGNNGNTRAIKNYDDIKNFISNKPEIIGFSPQITTQAIFSNNENGLPGVIYGISVYDEDRIYHLKSRIVSGNIYALNYNQNGIVLGQTLASKLNAKVGSSVKITTINGKIENLKVIAIFSFGISILDNGKAYMNIDKVRDILEYPQNYVSDIHIKLYNHFVFNDLANSLQTKFNVQVENWQDANKIIITGMQVRNVLTWVVSIALLIVAGFGIYNIMNINVINKNKDIAVLKTLGFSKKDIKTIFFIQSIFIGYCGALLGIVTGFILCFIMSKIPLDTGDLLSVKYYPMNFEIKFYLLGAWLGIITTIIAGFLPSRSASSVDPVNILRGI
jgi:lipoprotein-releasing system permease protein